MASTFKNKKAKVDEVTPEGITAQRPDRSYPQPCKHRHVSTFEVVPSHTKLTKKDGKVGVRFNVETLPDAHENDLHKPSENRKALIKILQAGWLSSSGLKLEALSEMDSNNANLVHVGTTGFVMALVTAFAEHLPLELSPDHIWMLISQAFAKHVDNNAEALRKNFVQHEGKRRLLVVTPASFAMSDGNDPDTGATAKEWEEMVFPEFSAQIKDHIGEKTHKAIAGVFSTTTPAAKAAHEIALMSTMKNYFSYGCRRTHCGIPTITLLGTKEDWVAVRSRAEHLGSLMMPDFSEYWMPRLLPILDEFVESYKGNVNHGFWQSMVKLRRTGAGSGNHSFISGWMQVLFPYLGSGCLNRSLTHWKGMYFRGPQLKDFPKQICSAPFDWEHFGVTTDMEFHSGILGFTQDVTTGALAPMLGWYVSRVSPKSAAEQLKVYKKELNDLLLGHKEDPKCGPWYKRVVFVQKKIAELDVAQG